MAAEGSMLFNLPLELRNAIYEFASDRPTGARLILKEYFEKIDQSIERLPPHPPVTIIHAATASDGQEEGEEDEPDEDDSEDSDIIAPDADSAMVGHFNLPAAIQIGDIAEQDTGNNADEDMQGEVDEDANDSLGEEDDEGSDYGNEDDEGQNEDDGDQEDDDDARSEDDDVEDEEAEDDDDQKLTGTAVPAPRPRNHGRDTKYRHMLPIVQLNHCPPPKELLQMCKQVKAEATQQYRDKCVLTIDVNKGFQHFSFFSETVTKLIDAPYSPLEHIRKLRLVITWDSEWLREKSTPPNREIEVGQMFFFGYYFSERMQVMINLINACPELQKVTIEYHDTEDTPESRNFMMKHFVDTHSAIASKYYQNADAFLVPVDVELEEHFSAAGTSHTRDSLLALRRTEFDRFLVGGFVMR